MSGARGEATAAIEVGAASSARGDIDCTVVGEHTAAVQARGGGDEVRQEVR